MILGSIWRLAESKQLTRRRLASRGVASAAGLLGLGGVALAAGVAPPPGVEPPAFEAAAAAYAAGKYGECQIAFANVARATGRAGLSARAAYGSACCAAQRGARDDAFGELGLAIANGFDDVERALTDERLAPLRTDQRWLGTLARMDEVRQLRVRALEPTLLGFWNELEAERASLAAGVTRSPDATAAERRRSATLALVDRGGLRQPRDYFHAAAVLADSDRSDDVGRAVALSRRALELDPDLLAARPLHALAVDRELLLAGRPQKFGTQTVLEAGRFKLYPVDPAVTDADRKLWGIPPLAELEARVPAAPLPPG
jgi:hypothetical protein